MSYENNLRYLEEKHNSIYKVIQDPNFTYNDGNIKIDTAKNNEKIVVYDNNGSNIYLNSRYNPASEAEKYLEELYDIPERAIISMYGLANGSFARDVLTKTNDQVLVMVYEPSVSIFMSVIKNIDISDILASGRLVLIVEGINEEYFDVVMGSALRAHNKNNNKHMTLPKYANLFPESYKNYADKVHASYDRLQLYSDTVASVGDVVCKNDILNFKYVLGCRCGYDYKDYFPEDMPVIIVSAGPSLAKNKHLLKEAKGKALIIAVDTAISSVMSIGVVPDMVITVDFDKDLKYFEAEGLAQIPFVIEPDSSHKVLEKVKPEKIIFHGTDVLLWTNFFKENGGNIYFLDIGGSVATYAIATAMSWNFKRIILMGQDLAFTGGSIHVGEDAQEYDFSTGKYSYIKGIDGNDIVTRRDYLTYLRWIEKIAYSNPDVEIIDATEGGALIEYTKVMTLRDVIDTYCKKEYDVKALVDGVPQYFLDGGKEIVINKLNELKEDLKKMKRTFNEGAIESHKGGLLLSRGDYNVKELKHITAVMQKADNMLLESEGRELLAKLTAVADNEFEIDMYQVEKDDIKESIRMYEKCEKYYRAQEEAIPLLIEYIDTCIASL